MASPDLRNLIEAARAAPVTPDAGRACDGADRPHQPQGRRDVRPRSRRCARARGRARHRRGLRLRRGRARRPAAARRQRRCGSPRSRTFLTAATISRRRPRRPRPPWPRVPTRSTWWPRSRPCSRAMSGLVGELIEACRAAAGPGITLKLILETGPLQRARPDHGGGPRRGHGGRRLPQDLDRQDRDRRHAGGGGGAARGLPRGRRAGGLQGGRRHPHRRRRRRLPASRRRDHGPGLGRARGPSASAPPRCSTICSGRAAPRAGY